MCMEEGGIYEQYVWRDAGKEESINSVMEVCREGGSMRKKVTVGCRGLVS